MASSDERTRSQVDAVADGASPRVLAFWSGGSASRDLAKLPIVVGRSQEADLRIDQSNVSRKHITLHAGRDATTLELEDLGSANGTRVSGRRLAARERVTLRSGELVEIGSAVIVFQTPARATDAALAPSSIERLVELVASSNISVVLLGETGVGKEVAASRIHELSERRERPFVRINCAALAETLLESELFGHERGAFTGAIKAKPGLLETATGGTLFLDEVGEMPLATQAKLLRVIESREVTRVGSVTAHPIDIRIVAATNRDLPAMVRESAFRSDLYFRLNGVTVRIPALRERKHEIAGLARALVARVAKGTRLAPEALAKLERHDWPGNVRELRNVIERAVMLARGADTLDASHVMFDELGVSVDGARVDPTRADLRTGVEEFERARIAQALRDAGGNQTRAAELLGISRRTLITRLEEYGLPRPRKSRVID